jgi:hypothetical protein
MAAPRDGIAAVVADAIDQAGPPPAPQPLLPLLDAHEIEAARDQGASIGKAVAEQARRPGRPRGALNKRTAAFREAILARYAHPAEALAAAYSRPVDTLAAELGCTKLEAFGLQIRAAGELLPYIESKMPVAVGVQAEGQIRFVLAADNGAQVIDGGQLTGLDALAMGIGQAIEIAAGEGE